MRLPRNLGDCFDASGLIVGIELSGNPSIDGRKFLPVLQRARKSGLKVSVHLAEVTDQLDEVEEFLLFRPDRIGHGTYLHTQDRYTDLMLQHRIPLVSETMLWFMLLAMSHHFGWNHAIN
ncbi:hypothetical protein ANCCAN_08656 [Ancylostoma caninum]|uniref:Uncharacterized protein n=1 Tax=Ancylostoma caninum TaxID=29170 RepID=A0A368GQP8_ANCCA|nr:hypothetical protein ANCCAN_08656 [Ancylostoma caninum]